MRALKFEMEHAREAPWTSKAKFQPPLQHGSHGDLCSCPRWTASKHQQPKAKPHSVHSQLGIT